jgi:hypothetical protein
MWDDQGKDGEFNTLEDGGSLDSLYPVAYYYYVMDETK